eukprot:PhF_6_TR24447/c0_g2_i4/m.33808
MWSFSTWMKGSLLCCLVVAYFLFIDGTYFRFRKRRPVCPTCQHVSSPRTPDLPHLNICPVFAKLGRSHVRRRLWSHPLLALRNPQYRPSTNHVAVCASG